MLILSILTLAVGVVSIAIALLLLQRIVVITKTLRTIQEAKSAVVLTTTETPSPPSPQALTTPQQSEQSEQPSPAAPPQQVNGKANTKKQQHQSSPHAVQPRQHCVTIRYATLQAPDSRGRLRFAERTMVTQQDNNKFFIVELDTAAGRGIYRLNPQALPAIRADLQQFQDYVLPFTLTGDPRTATIHDKNYGTIHREDHFWVVDKKLEIAIK